MGFGKWLCASEKKAPRVKVKTYDYDHNGNQTKISSKICSSETADVLRVNLWDEENRLRAIDLNPSSPFGGGGGLHPIAIYTYDAGGERIIKHNSTNVAIYENALKVGEKNQPDFMIYPSGMLVFRPSFGGDGGGSYTKHYFAGTQRVSSKIGTTTNLGNFLEEWQQQEQSSPSYPAITTQAQMDNANTGATKVFGLKGFNFTNPPIITGGNTSFVPIAAFTATGTETDQYYFHPDHLGSSNYITNFVGEVSQHSEYFAFGETFIEEHKNSHNSPYKFNGKELDEESGLYYYGARYYDPRISIWASVDPLVEKTMSAYGYCNLNPVNLIDPSGMSSEDPDDPGKKSWFGRAWDTVKGWFGSNKSKSKVTCGEAEWSFIGVTSLETGAVVTETAPAVEATTTTIGATGMSATCSGVLALPLLCTGDTPRDREPDAYLYRNMKDEPGFFNFGPMLGQTANTLGIRPTDVLNKAFSENISPLDNSGLSVTIGTGTYKSDSVTPQSVPNYGKNTTLWRLDPKQLIPLGLILAPQPSPPGYGRILPLYNMSIQSFHEKIQLTQSLWRIAPSNRN